MPPNKTGFPRRDLWPADAAPPRDTTFPLGSCHHSGALAPVQAQQRAPRPPWGASCLLAGGAEVGATSRGGGPCSQLSPASAVPGSSSFLLCCPSRALGSRMSPGPDPTGQSRAAPSMEPSETACPPSSTSGAPRRRSRHQQKDSAKHFIPRLSAALWPLAKSPQTGQGQSPWPGPRRQRLPVWVCPRKSQGVAYSFRKIRHLLLAGMSTCVRYFGWRSCPGRPPVSPARPTYHLLQEQAVSLAQVFQEGCVAQSPLRVPARGKEVESWPEDHPAHLPSQPGPLPTQF